VRQTARIGNNNYCRFLTASAYVLNYYLRALSKLALFQALCRCLFQ